jgi:radical SAM protein with 4Fe4S-binding SPASM domain
MSLEGPSHEPMALNPYNQIYAQAERQHRLLTVHWEMTYRCNERCTHCYLDVLPPNAHVPDELTTTECLHVIDEMADMGVLNLAFSGGEILTRRDFFEIAEYAHSKQFLVRLFTNGILIKPQVADRIAGLHPYAVELSLYGADAETHERITMIPRSYDLTLRAARLLIERGVRVVLKTPLMHENVRQINTIRSLVQDMGAQFRYDITITPKDSGVRSPLVHRISYQDLIWLFRQEIKAEQWVQRVPKLSSPTCGISLASLLIDPTGNVFPCVQTRALAGNLRQQSLKTIWQTAPLWSELKQLTLGALPVCRTCELQSMCVRCHGTALLEDGDLRAPATINCHEALARRQVLVEQGALPSDFPIPSHLQSFADQVRSSLPDDQLISTSSLAVFS